MYLLDTNVLSEMRKASRTKASSAKIDRHVENWLNSVSADEFHISVVSISRIGARIPFAEKKGIPDKLRSFGGGCATGCCQVSMAEFSSVDRAVVQRCAALAIPRPIEYRDSLIAATALVHGMTVVTRNVRHFGHTGADILNPWNE